MKRTFRAAALLGSLALAGAARAQQAAPARTAPRVGIGVGLAASELSAFNTFTGGIESGVLPAQIYVPINVTPSFRLEPQFGLFTAKQDGGDEASRTSLGTGAFWLVPLAQQAQLYLGGRIVLSWLHEDLVGGAGVVTKVKGTDLWLAAALGGEVLLHPRVGVGAEAQLGRFGIGDRTFTTAGVETTQAGGSSWQTQGILFLRVYLL